MRRGTTPRLTLRIDDVDLRIFRSICVTLREVGDTKQYTYDETCPNVEILRHKIVIRLSQEETLRFKEGTVLVQARMVTHNDIAVATDIVGFNVGRVLLNGEIG